MPRLTDKPRSAWYQQPVLWLGIAVFVGSLAGCVWMITLAVQHDDAVVQAPRPVFGVPARTHARPAHTASSHHTP
jgi:hypothetical protein